MAIFGQDDDQVPSPMRQAVSQGLAETAFGFFGSAAAEAVDDPNVAVPIQQMGTRIAQAMQQRWWSKEFENFNAEHGELYQARSMELMNRVKQDFNNINNGFYTDEQGNTIEIDPAGEQAARLRDNLLRDATMRFTQFGNDYMNAAGKYAANPFVNNAVQAMMQQTTQTIQGVTGPSQAVAGEQQYAQLELTREEANLKKRLPQPHASSSRDREDQDPYSLWLKLKNPAKYMSEIMTNRRDWLLPFMASAKSKVEADYIRRSPNQELVNQPDVLDRDWETTNLVYLS